MTADVRSSPAADSALVRAAAQATMRWPFRMWAFGEAVALRGLLRAADRTGDAEPLGFVRALLRASVGRGLGRSPDDHVAPGTELLLLHARDGDDAWLAAAEALADLHARTPMGPHGARYTRHHLPGWRRQIWVDSMAVAPPFLARLAIVTGRDALAREAIGELTAYCRLLQDEATGLLVHGHEEDCGRTGQLWARGNGWAAMGLAETLALLSPAPGAPAGAGADADAGIDDVGAGIGAAAGLDAASAHVTELRERLVRLLDGLARHQDASGLWHTIVDGEDTPLESTLAAMTVCAVDEAERAGIVSRGRYAAMRDRARAALLAHVRPSGELDLVTDATPIGERRLYATRPFGTFPWGQGPLLLVLAPPARGGQA